MADAADPIPEDSIFLVDAFDTAYRTITPDWREIGRRLMDYSIEEFAENEANRASHHIKTWAWVECDRAETKAHEWLLSRICDGSLTTFIHDPESNKTFQLSRQDWDIVVLEESSISSNFVGPDDRSAPGPDTRIRSLRRPVFFKRANFEEVLKSSFADVHKSEDHRTGMAGRPTVKHLIEREIDRRVAANERIGGRQATAKSLIQWFTDTYPDSPKPTPKTILNSFPEKIRKLTVAQNKVSR